MYPCQITAILSGILDIKPTSARHGTVATIFPLFLSLSPPVLPSFLSALPLCTFEGIRKKCAQQETRDFLENWGFVHFFVHLSRFFPVVLNGRIFFFVSLPSDWLKFGISVIHKNGSAAALFGVRKCIRWWKMKFC